MQWIHEGLDKVAERRLFGNEGYFSKSFQSKRNFLYGTVRSDRGRKAVSYYLGSMSETDTFLPRDFSQVCGKIVTSIVRCGTPLLCPILLYLIYLIVRSLVSRCSCLFRSTGEGKESQTIHQTDTEQYMVPPGPSVQEIEKYKKYMVPPSPSVQEIEKYEQYMVPPGPSVLEIEKYEQYMVPPGPSVLEIEKYEQYMVPPGPSVQEIEKYESFLKLETSNSMTNTGLFSHVWAEIPNQAMVEGMVLKMRTETFIADQYAAEKPFENELRVANTQRRNEQTYPSNVPDIHIGDSAMEHQHVSKDKTPDIAQVSNWPTFLNIDQQSIEQSAISTVKNVRSNSTDDEKVSKCMAAVQTPQHEGLKEPQTVPTVHSKVKNKPRSSKRTKNRSVNTVVRTFKMTDSFPLAVTETNETDLEEELLLIDLPSNYYYENLFSANQQSTCLIKLKKQKRRNTQQ